MNLVHWIEEQDNVDHLNDVETRLIQNLVNQGNLKVDQIFDHVIRSQQQNMMVHFIR